MGAGWVVSYQLPCGHHRKLSVRNGDVVDEEIGTERDGIPLSSDIPDPRRDSSSAFSGILQKYHGQLWDVREVIKMNVHLIPQNTPWSTIPKQHLTRVHLSAYIASLSTLLFRGKLRHSKSWTLCCDVQQIVQGEWDLCFLAWQCPCHLPPKSRRPAPLCDSSIENVKGEQIPPSNLWGGWTLHPLAMTRGDWKSPLVVIFFLPPFSAYPSMSLCISLASWHDIFIHWLFSLCTLQASETPLQSIQMSMRISVSLLFLSCLRLIFYFPLSILAFSDCCLTYTEGSHYQSYSQSSWRRRE